jgi:hypothetical protein
MQNGDHSIDQCLALNGTNAYAIRAALERNLGSVYACSSNGQNGESRTVRGRSNGGIGPAVVGR